MDNIGRGQTEGGCPLFRVSIIRGSTVHKRSVSLSTHTPYLCQYSMDELQPNLRHSHNKLTGEHHT